MRAIYDLSGEWELYMEKGGSAAVAAAADIKQLVFEDVMALPGTTAQAGKSPDGENMAVETGYLTERYPFEGNVWYRREIFIAPEDAGQPMYLYLERSRMTTLWVNGQRLGSCNSICAPHCYMIGSDVTKEAKVLELVICVNNKDYPTRGGHMTSPDTQTNWTGILGKLELRVMEKADVVAATATADAARGEIVLKLTAENTTGVMAKKRISVQGDYYIPDENGRVHTEAVRFTGIAKEDTARLGESAVEQKSAKKDAAEQKLLKERAAEPELSEERVAGQKPAKERAAGPEQTIELILAPGTSVHHVTLVVDQPRLFSEFTPGYGKLELYVDDTESMCAGQDCVVTADNESEAALVTGQEPLEIIFGFRRFTTDRHHFYINGKKTYLRGKHDGMVFPLTGAAPMEVEGWLAVMKTAKEYGINHYRFHTCCPPEAAFFAADLLGIYMEPELPFWGTIADRGEEGYNEAEQEYLIQEGFRLMEAFGGHPSFVMMSLGNELWGSGKRLGEILNGFKAVDRRHLYTSGSNNFQFYPFDIPEEEFFAGVRFGYDSLIRGSYAMCDAPQGFVQTEQPNTAHSYDGFFDVEAAEEAAGGEIEIQYGTGVKKVKADAKKAFTTDKPILSHEVGQYCTYPDFKEIEKYTGVLKARNFEEFRRRLEAAGMAEQAEDFFRDSGALAAFCYKLEIEAAQRSKMLAGYQLLDLQDFPGQGTALVGVLNALMEPKGIISKEDWNSFCAQTVVLAELPGFVYQAGEAVHGELVVAHYGEKALPAGRLVVKLEEIAKKNASGKEIESSTANIDREENREKKQSVIILADLKLSAENCTACVENGVAYVGDFAYTVPELTCGRQYELKLELYAGDMENVVARNRYPLYAYPAVCDSAAATAGLTVTTDATEALSALQSGARVLYFLEKTKDGLEGTYCTDFWCYPMFRSISESMNRRVPIGTLGLTIKNTHPALKGFACDTHSTPQWYGIVTKSEAVNLTGTALKPIVQVIDNFERNHKLGLLFEARCGGGSLLVCSSRPWELKEDAAATAFFESIRDYAAGDDFCPQEELTEEEFRNIFTGDCETQKK